MNFKYTHIILFFLGILTSLNSQSYVTEIIPLRKGVHLNSSFINQFFEDSRGFMWMANKEGVCRFDGNDYNYFFQDSKLPHSRICLRLVEDIEGNIWTYFLTQKGGQDRFGGQYYYLIDKDFKVHSINDFFGSRMPFKSADIRHIHQHKNILYLVLYSGVLYKFDGSFHKILSLSQAKDPTINQVNEQGEIILSSRKFIWKISPDGKQIEKNNHFQHYPALSIGYTPEDPEIISHFFDGFLKMIITKKGSKLFRHRLIYPEFWNSLPDEKTIQAYYLKSPKQTVFLIVAQNRFVIFNQNGQLIADLPCDFTKIGTPHHDVNFIFHRENQLWFHTNKNIFILNYRPAVFETHFTQQRGFSTRGIVATKQNKLIVVSNSNIKIKDLTTGEIQSKTTIKNRIIWGICETSDSTLLLGSYDHKLREYDFKNDNYSHYILRKRNQDIFPYQGPFIPYKDRQGNIYVGTSNGLVTLNTQTDSLEVFEKYNEFSSLSSAHINYFYEEQDDIWVASSSGLFQLNAEKGVTNYFEALADYPIYHLHKEDSIFWLATYGEGLIKWNIETNEVQEFGHQNGFLSEFLTAIYPDNQGYLWIASENGLIHFNKITHESHIFFEADGISHNEFNRASHYQGQDGTIFLGGLNGITSFHPDTIIDLKQSNFPFMLTNFEIYNDKKGAFTPKSKQFYTQKAIELSPNERTFKLHFSLLNYQEPDKTIYAYYIEGLYKNWIQQRENFIRFNEIPYGKYLLKIKAKSEKWNKQTIEIPITVNPPFYLRPYWQLLGAVMLFLILFIGYKGRVKILKNEQIRLEQLVKERTQTIQKQNQNLKNLNNIKDRLFAILAHDLKNPLLAFKSVSESIDYLIENKELGRIKQLGLFIEKEAHQLYNVLSNLLYWALANQKEFPVQFTTISLSELGEKLVKDFKHLTTTGDVQLINNIPPKTEIFTDIRLLETIMRNILSNAFRFTGKGGSIKMSAMPEKNSIKIIIEDTGTGMTPQQLATLFEINGYSKGKSDNELSTGLHLCKKLVELLKGTINAESKINHGSKFMITLPSN